MDPIERFLGIAADGGTGALGLVRFVVPLTAIAVLAVARSPRRRDDRQTQTRRGSGRHSAKG